MQFLASGVLGVGGGEQYGSLKVGGGDEGVGWVRFMKASTVAD